MVIVEAMVPAGKSVDEAAFADLTVVPVLSVEWGSGGQVRVFFDGDLDEATVSAVVRRIMSRSPAEEAVRGRLAAALPGLNEGPLCDLIRLALNDFTEPN